MGEAREVMDRLTNAVFITKDIKAAAECYAVDAVGVSPDAGELHGREAIGEYLREFIDAFPDLRYDYIAKHESGDAAIDEGTMTGTHTGPLSGPDGAKIAGTGRTITVRGSDVCTVRGGEIVRHHFYFDQLEFLTQLGLLQPPS